MLISVREASRGVSASRFPLLLFPIPDFLQLQLLQVVDSLASVTLPCLGSIDVLVQRLLYVVALHPQLT